MKKCKLGDIADIITGPFGSQLHASDYVKQGVPSIMPKDIGERRVIEDTIAHISEVDAQRLSRYLVQLGDIVYSRRGDIERCALIRKENVGSLCGTGCLRVRPNAKEIDSEYLSYYLSTPKIRKWIVDNATGATMPNLNSDILRLVPLEIPNLEQQKRIACILSSFDEKIDLNNRLNATLESMAKTLYDYWFVQFDFPDEYGRPYKTSSGSMTYNKELGREIPTGWDVDNLYRIADYENGLACQNFRPQAHEDFLPVIKIKEMHEGITAATERVKADIPETKIIDDGDILFSWSATLEVQYWTGGKGGLNQHIFKVIPHDDFPKEYVYHQLKEYVVNFVKIAEARKTTMGHITSDHLQFSRIAIPSPDILQNFAKTMKPIHQRMITNKQENRRLTQLRDFLLPLLMNGQVTFK